MNPDLITKVSMAIAHDVDAQLDDFDVRLDWRALAEAAVAAVADYIRDGK